MKHITTMMTLLLCTICLTKAHAVTIYECVDEAGNSTFQDHCPPGTTPANEQEIKTGAAEEEAAPEDTAEAPTEGGGDITFYTTSMECDACVIIKSTLTKYGAGFTEKDISTDMAVREELRNKTGGTSAVVPTVVIGDQVITGYNKDALSKALENAGYTKPEPPAVEAAGQKAASAPGETPAPPAESEETP